MLHNANSETNPHKSEIAEEVMGSNCCTSNVHQEHEKEVRSPAASKYKEQMTDEDKERYEEFECTDLFNSLPHISLKKRLRETDLAELENDQRYCLNRIVFPKN